MIRLEAHELTNRRGFEQTLEELSALLEANGYDPSTSRPLPGLDMLGDEYLVPLVLAEAIEKYLAPAVSPAVIHRSAGAGGNPVGVSYPDIRGLSLDDFLVGRHVDVSEDDILRIAATLGEDFGIERPTY